MRVTAALRLDDRALAALIGTTPKQIAFMKAKDAHELSDLAVDPMWTGIAHEVDRQIGELMAIREELRRKLARDEKNRMARRMRIERR